jgi:TatD DNase family protein
LFNVDLDSLVQDAKERGIIIITSAITKESWQRGIDIASKFQHVFPSVGLNPTQYQDISHALEFIKKSEEDLIAIGEIGLDHFLTRNHSERDSQEKSFRSLLRLAQTMALPVQIHSRSAGRVTLEVLYDCEMEHVHMHAFDGKSSFARIASNEFGYYFSIPTSVVRSPQKQKLVKAVNIERLLLETDSPVLSPVKGERNSPLNITIALKEVSRILRRDEEELREIILENTFRLYKKLR